MPLLDNQAIKHSTDEVLEGFLDSKIHDGAAYGKAYQSLLERIREQILRGGKRLRPYLVYLGHQAAGGEGTPPFELLAATELLHQSLLFHDDIIDRDVIRYGGPNVIGRYQDELKGSPDASHFANVAAILAGDLCYSWVIELAKSNEAARRSFTEQFETVQAGQLLDSLPGAFSPGTIDETLQVHRCKTAAYSTTGPLTLGATLAGGSAKTVRQMREFGEALGIVVGLTDDLLGMFGDEAKTGKPTCSDLHENKPTPLFFYARELATGADRSTILAALGSPHHSDEDLAPVRDALGRCGARARTEELTARYQADARAALTGLSGPAAAELRRMPAAIAAHA